MDILSPDKLSDLKNHAREIRVNVIRSLTEAGSGHTGGSLGLADIFTFLYFHSLRHHPDDPYWAERDRLILSIGHVAPVLYASLAQTGYFPKEELLGLRKLGSRLQGHPGRDHGLPGLELSAGSLGQGLSVAVGMALAARMDNTDWRVICVMGDGELQEGSIWEAAMSAAHHKLDKLIGIVDRNHCQIDGKTADVMELEPLADKWKAFGWDVFFCNGHDFQYMARVWDQITTKEARRPSVILAETLMGKGISHIEGDYRWHGKAPSPAERDSFIAEIQSS